MGTSDIACITGESRGTPLGDIILLIIADLGIDSGLYGAVWRMRVTFVKNTLTKIASYTHQLNITLRIILILMLNLGNY